MDFRDNQSQAAWRTEVRDFLQTEKPSALEDVDPREARSAAGAAFKAWREKLAKKGWIASAWPKEYGGAGLGVMDQFILNEEFAEARVMNAGG
ncbi:MAG TPA: acyl-CoA dehydrogenase family protein, partial [Tepidiformaceae bacterium]